MKVDRKLLGDITPAARHEIIVSTWQSRGEAPIDAAELMAIHRAVADLIDESQLPGPAAIARELAQAGAELKHPEIIECDARWRAQKSAEMARDYASLSVLDGTEPPHLREAEAAIAQLERLRNRSSEAVDEVMAFAVEARRAAQNRANDAALSPSVRAVQSEITEWLRVWLQTPALFEQWIELRKQSEDFRTKFGAY